jgi:hypothetical protein
MGLKFKRDLYIVRHYVYATHFQRYLLPRQVLNCSYFCQTQQTKQWYLLEGICLAHSGRGINTISKSLVGISHIRTIHNISLKFQIPSPAPTYSEWGLGFSILTSSAGENTLYANHSPKDIIRRYANP